MSLMEVLPVVFYAWFIFAGDDFVITPRVEPHLYEERNVEKCFIFNKSDK